MSKLSNVCTTGHSWKYHYGFKLSKEPSMNRTSKLKYHTKLPLLNNVPLLQSGAQIVGYVTCWYKIVELAHLSQEDISIEAHSLHLLISSLIDQLRKVGPHTDIDCFPHLCWQGPQFLLVLLQGLLIKLQTQGLKVSQRWWACRKDTLTFLHFAFLCQVFIIIFREWISVLAPVKLKIFAKPKSENWLEPRWHRLILNKSDDELF